MSPVNFIFLRFWLFSTEFVQFVERKQTFYPISKLYKETNLQIRLSFPHYIVLFVILGLFFFTASFQLPKA